MATTRSSSSSRHYAGTLWVRVLRKVLGILKDTANTDACCCYRRLSWWTEHVPHDALPNEPRNVLRDTNEFNIDSLCFETHLFHSRELSSKRRWAIDSDGVVEISSVVKVVLLTMCFLVFAFCLTGCNSRWDLSLSENDSVLFGTYNQVQLSVYVYVFFFFPKQVFGFTQALRTFSAEPNTMLWFKRHCLGILQSVDLLNMMQLTHILSRFKLTTYAVSRSLAAGNCFRKPRHPAVRNFDQFSRNSSINSP